MLRMKYAVGLSIVLAAGLLFTNAAVCDDKPGQQPAVTTERWDDGGPIASDLFAQAGPVPGDNIGPPGPRPAGDDRPMPPPRGQGPGAGRMQGPPPDRDNDRPGMGRGPGMGMGPGMNPNCPVGGMGGMRANDPEMLELFQKDGQLDRDAHHLAAQYQQAAGEKREKIQKELEELVNKQFDVRQQRRNLELKRLEDQLQRLRDAVSRREKVRKELVEKRVAELLGIDKELDF